MLAKRALISVFDKTGIVDFARGLTECGFEILSTGGTASIVRDAGIPVIDVSLYTGFPEILDGRVKTLHPKIHGGLLYLRGNTAHEEVIQKYAITPIDLVVIDLYPEEIDIGGVSLIRSGAKNHASVTVVTDQDDYAPVLAHLRAEGDTTLEMRHQLARKAFIKTSAYDAAIAARV